MSEDREAETQAPREAATPRGATSEPDADSIAQSEEGVRRSRPRPTTPLDYARVYRQHLRLFITPIRPREKAPFLTGWATRQLTDEEVEQYFGQDGCNIGVLNGGGNRHLVDIDIDASEAVFAAGEFLPATRCIFGRASKRASHWLYTVPGLATAKYQDFAGEHRVLIEVRSTGSQTVWPGSTHPSGEAIEFEQFGEPAPVEADELLRRVGQVAACALIARHWPKGARHDAALAYAGYLGRNGCDGALVYQLILTAARCAGDDELPDRERAIEDTLGKLDSGGPVSGLPTLATILGQEEADRIGERLKKWLGLSSPSAGCTGGLIDDVGADGERLSDLGNARRLANRHGQKLRYVHARNAWFVYEGKRWAVDETGEVVRLAHETLHALTITAALEQDKRKREELLRHALFSEADHRIRAMVSQAQALLPARASDFDADPYLLNVENGTLDLRTGDLRPHRIEDRITKLAPVEYDPTATHPVWERFLGEAGGGDAELAVFLQRAVGYSLTGDTREEKLFFVHGPAASGKSTFIEAIKAALGEYAKTASFDAFLKREGGGAREDLARLAGSRFVASSEVDEGKALAEGIVKSFTGGDTVSARHLYQATFEYRPQFKLWLVANHKPKVSAEDTAMWRRILLVPFEHVVPEERRDPRVKASLTDPAEAGRAILAWAVRGALAWRKDGLAVPKVVRVATEAYRAEMDVFDSFLEDRCVIGREYEVAFGDLFAAYEDWRRKSRERPLTRKGLAAQLKAHGFQPGDSTRVRTYVGVGLSSAPRKAGPVEEAGRR